MSKKESGSANGMSGLTRRQVLKRLGAVGGSSLVLSAMSAWDLRGAPIRPRPHWTGNQQGTRVAVLGAGVSGLVVGYELRKLGYDVQILEARERVGGLNWSVSRGAEHTELGPGGEHQVCQFDEGQYFNAGPWRLPHDHHGILGYCKELDVRLEEFRDDDAVMFSEDPALGELANRKIYLRELRSDMWGHTAELLAKAVERGPIDTDLNAEDLERLVEWLVRAGYLESGDLVYRPNAEVRGSEEKYDFSALLGSPFANQVRSISAGTGGPEPVLQPTGGMMQIPLALHRSLESNVTLGARVMSVTQMEEGVRIAYGNADGGEMEELTADYAVFCLPMSILKQLDVNFSPEMAQAVAASGHSSSSKMGLQMARRFWEEDDGIYGGHLQYDPYDPNSSGRSPNPIPSFSYPSNDYGSKKGVLLGFYGNPAIPGLDGEPLIDAPVQARFDHVLHHAGKVHPQITEEFEAAYAVWWPKVRFSEGAWAGNPGDRLQQLGEGDGRFYIGSAGASDHPAWQEGAVEAAWRAVESLHSRVSAE